MLRKWYSETNSFYKLIKTKMITCVKDDPCNCNLFLDYHKNEIIIINTIKGIFKNTQNQMKKIRNNNISEQ